MSEKEEGKVHRIVLTEALSIADTIAPSTIQSALKATGSLAQYDQYYAEALGTVERAAQAGSMNPHDISMIKETLRNWRRLSEDYHNKIIDLTKEEKPEKLIDIKQEIDEHIPSQRRMIHNMYEKIVGTTTWNKLIGFFDVSSSNKEETAFFKGKSHQALVELLVEWIETIDKEKVFGNIIHGPREAGLDVIVQVSSGYKPKFGIQIKNNEDIEAKDFALRLKAQITESKKHKIQGLIIFLAADMTENSVESKIVSILSDISQMDDPFVKAIAPERAMTIISKVI